MRYKSKKQRPTSENLKGGGLGTRGSVMNRADEKVRAGNRCSVQERAFIDFGH